MSQTKFVGVLSGANKFGRPGPPKPLRKVISRAFCCTSDHILQTLSWCRWIPEPEIRARAVAGAANLDFSQALFIHPQAWNQRRFSLRCQKMRKVCTRKFIWSPANQDDWWTTCPTCWDGQNKVTSELKWDIYLLAWNILVLVLANQWYEGKVMNGAKGSLSPKITR